MIQPLSEQKISSAFSLALTRFENRRMEENITSPLRYPCQHRRSADDSVRGEGPIAGEEGLQEDASEPEDSTFASATIRITLPSAIRKLLQR